MDQKLGRRPGGRLLAAAAVLVVLVIAFSGPAAAHAGDDGSHHHDGWMGSHGGALGSMWMVWMIVLIGVPLGLGSLFLTRRDAGSGTTDDALTVLRRRYAEGEINEEEFDARRRKLQGGE